MGIETIYKWVDAKNCTDSYGGDSKYCHFGRDKMVSKPLKRDGEYYLCSQDVLHAFPTMTQAMMKRGSLVLNHYCKLWKGLGNVVARDHQKVGCQWIKLQTLVDLPAYTKSPDDYFVQSRHYVGVLAYALDIHRPTKLDEMGYFYSSVYDNLDRLLRKAKVPKGNRPTLYRVVCSEAQYLLEDMFRWEQNYPKEFGFVTPRVLEYELNHKLPLVKN